jgi:hypothetical protein
MTHFISPIFATASKIGNESYFWSNIYLSGPEFAGFCHPGFVLQPQNIFKMQALEPIRSFSANISERSLAKTTFKPKKTPIPRGIHEQRECFH